MCLHRSGLGPDSLELLGICLEYSRRSKPLQVKQRVLISTKPIQVWGNKHLVIEAVNRIVERNAMESYFDATIRKQCFQLYDCGADPARERSSQPSKIV